MRDEPLTFGSLFAGIGGFDLGLERAGLRCLWQCEIDEFAISVLEEHWPGVLRVRDVRDVTSTSVPRVDVVCGGFPCQDISNAGPRTGMAGARSGLWGEMFRIVCELRPRYVLVENVSALLARGLGRVLGDLAASGYDAEWDCLPAAAFGAPHRRDRLWLLAYPSSEPLRDQPGWFDGPDGAAAPVTGLDGQQGAVADSLGARLEGHGPGTNGRRTAPRGRPRTRDVADPDGVGQDWWAGQAPGANGGPEPTHGGPQLADADGTQRASQSRASQALRGPGTFQRPRRRGGVFGDTWAVEPDVGRVAHGVPARVDRIRTLGNSLIPEIAEWIGERIQEHESQR